MKELKDEEIRRTIQALGDSIFLGEDDSERLFQKIRLRTEERRTVMRISRGKKLALALAAVLVIGSVSAIAAGRVASLSSSTDLKEAIQSAEETAREAGSIFGITPDYAEAFENGYQFDRGFVTAVEMADENGVSMGSIPQCGQSSGSLTGPVGCGGRAERKERDTLWRYNALYLRGSIPVPAAG